GAAGGRGGSSLQGDGERDWPGPPAGRGPPPARGGSRRGTRPPEPAPESRRTARPSPQFTTRPRRFVPARSEPCRGPSRGDWAVTENCTTTLAGWGESDASTGHSQCGWRLPRHQRGDPGRGPDGQP